MNPSWNMPGPVFYNAMVLDSTNSGTDSLGQEDRIHRPSKALRRPRGRPPLHPFPTTTPNAQDGSVSKRTWKRKNPNCSPSELREHHLHRNRVAACKYRKKHKRWSDTLAERCKAEAEKRNFLHELTRSLKEEVLSLKEQAIHQSGCDCVIMKLYLERQTINLLGLPEWSPILTPPSQYATSPTSSPYTSFDDNFFDDFI
jgi:hypothetical protein